MNNPRDLANNFFHIPKEDIEKRKLKNPEFIEEILLVGKWFDDVFVIPRSKAEDAMSKHGLMPPSVMHARAQHAKMAAASNNSILQPIKNFTGSMKNWVANGMPMVSKEVYETRKAICDNCPFWDKDGNMGMGKCKQCGCTSAKLHLATEKCPIDKWGPVKKD